MPVAIILRGDRATGGRPVHLYRSGDGANHKLPRRAPSAIPPTCTPTGGPTWNWTHMGIQAASISCISPSLCLVSSATGSGLAVIRNPSGNPRVKLTGVDHGAIPRVHCTPRPFCVAADSNGKVLRSTNPTGPRRAWTIQAVDRAGLDDVACPSTTLCIGVDRFGYVTVGRQAKRQTPNRSTTRV